ncbi:hypothetical protein [Flavilitoribacter nigricans]|uniref:Uncharacterized protein n=1 Tax=Flavilitoribacter nigricans (strain ATCC 23147 / DSM 23189 / NBRC 102662 / NCIMB 1420 / SS-2) TaxID=1122177 RepID=A0A2D0NDW1_FLAN2|nr:hypothetical protein [Flavilitoribacter nigricans]PHN06560.1 hypothetical protein CRP01_09655 [Flavilitoribacter nigricans DSM 23189 = NBRC 102662]
MRSSIIYLPLFCGLLLLLGCGKERFETDYEAYQPGVISSNDGAVAYQNLETFPVLETIASTEPTFEYASSYKFLIDTIKAPASATGLNQFAIDPKTGVISYNNAAGGLAPGDYIASVVVQYPKGIAQYDDIFTLNVKAVPLDIAIDQESVEAGSLEQGVIATVSYVDNSGGEITEVTYELINAPDIYTIDANTGAISKTGAAAEGAQPLSVAVTTNLGVVKALNLLTVNVGPAPTLSYFQQDGLTPLTKVTLSPWTAYTTATPQLRGMNAVEWELILPEALTPFADYLSITEGAISVAADANLPEGDHLIGAIATNAGGVGREFPELLTLSVVFQWTPYFDDQLNSEENDVLPEEAFPGVWAGYDLSGEAASGGWKKIANVGGGNFSGMRRFNPGTLDACLVRTVDITGVKALRFSFAELIGYGGAFTNRYARELYYGDDVSSLEASAFVEAEWQTLLAPDGPWQGINWNQGNGPVNEYEHIPVDLSTISGNTLYLNWRLFSKDVAAGNQNGQLIIDAVSAEIADVFGAIEE